MPMFWIHVLWQASCRITAISYCVQHGEETRNQVEIGGRGKFGGRLNWMPAWTLKTRFLKPWRSSRKHLRLRRRRKQRRKHKQCPAFLSFVGIGNGFPSNFVKPASSITRPEDAQDTLARIEGKMDSLLKGHGEATRKHV